MYNTLLIVSRFISKTSVIRDAGASVGQGGRKKAEGNGNL